MNKAILGIGACCLLLAAACEKDRDVPVPVPDYSNTWRLGAASYVAASQAVSLASGRWQLSAATGGTAGYIEHGITFQFNTPTTPPPGRYLIVPGNGNGDQASVLVQNNNAIKVTNYSPTGHDSIYLTVLLLDTTKVSVSLPPVWVINADTARIDSVQTSAVLIQQP